jgi:hypothetical protein
MTADAKASHHRRPNQRWLSTAMAWFPVASSVPLMPRGAFLRPHVHGRHCAPADSEESLRQRGSSECTDTGLRSQLPRIDDHLICLQGAWFRVADDSIGVDTDANVLHALRPPKSECERVTDPPVGVWTASVGPKRLS